MEFEHVDESEVKGLWSGVKLLVNVGEIVPFVAKLPDGVVFIHKCIRKGFIIACETVYELELELVDHAGDSLRARFTHRFDSALPFC